MTVVKKDQPIIFFDGVCGLCNGFVDQVVRLDREGIFRLAPLQGETARRLLGERQADSTWSMIYLDERGLHDQSDASLEICRRLGGPWRAVALLKWIPRRVRNWLYGIVARNRYRWFGRRESCRIPGPDEKDRFLP